MLKNIPMVISPELLKILSSMGHGDEIVVADANFPAETCGKRVIRAEGTGGEAMLDAVMSLIPLDNVSKENCFFMATGDDSFQPPIWSKYLSVIAERGERACTAELDRNTFYERAKQAYAVIQTGEKELFANIIVRKGTL